MTARAPIVRPRSNRRRGPGKYRAVLGSVTLAALLTAAAGTPLLWHPSPIVPDLVAVAPDVRAWIEHQVREYDRRRQKRLRWLQYLEAEGREQFRNEHSPARLAMYTEKVRHMQLWIDQLHADRERFVRWVTDNPELLMGVAPVVAGGSTGAGGEGGPAPWVINSSIAAADITAGCPAQDCEVRWRARLNGAALASQVARIDDIDGTVELGEDQQGFNACNVFRAAGAAIVQVIVADNEGLSSAWTTVSTATIAAEATRTVIFQRADGDDAQSGATNTAGGAVETFNGAFSKCTAALHYAIHIASGTCVAEAASSPDGTALSIYVKRLGADVLSVASGVTMLTPDDGYRNILVEGLDIRAGGVDNNTVLVLDGGTGQGVTFLDCETGAGANGFSGIFVTTGTGGCTGFNLINHVHDTTITTGQGIFSSRASQVVMWGCEWLENADGQQLARFAGAENGNGVFTFNYCVFDKGGNGNAPLRIYGTELVTVYRCDLSDTTDSSFALGSSNDEGTGGPDECDIYRISRCRMIECGIQAHTLMSGLRVVDCLFTSAAGHRCLGFSQGAFSEAGDFATDARIINCVTESTSDGGCVAGDAFANGAGDHVREFWAINCLRIVPGTYTETHYEFIVSAAGAATALYRFGGDTVDQNDIVAWEEFSDTDTVAVFNALAFVGTCELEGNTIDAAGQPSGTTVKTRGRPLTEIGTAPIGAFRSINGTRRNPAGATCYSGAWQPAQAAPTSLVVTPAAGQVTLAWTAAAGAVDYIVHYGTAEGHSAATQVVAGTSVTIGSLPDGTLHHFRVYARNLGSMSEALEGTGTPGAGTVFGRAAARLRVRAKRAA